MPDHREPSVADRLHLEGFLRTSAQYLGLSTQTPGERRWGSLCRKPLHAPRAPLVHDRPGVGAYR
jgi:hypothetical protein